MKSVAIVALVGSLVAAAPAFAASRAPADISARQYESLVQRDAGPAAFEQSPSQGRTINAWGHTFTVD